MVVYSAAKRPLLVRVIICEPQHQVEIKMGHSLSTIDYKIVLIRFLSLIKAPITSEVQKPKRENKTLLSTPQLCQLDLQRF